MLAGHNLAPYCNSEARFSNVERLQGVEAKAMRRIGIAMTSIGEAVRSLQ